MWSDLLHSDSTLNNGPLESEFLTWEPQAECTPPPLQAREVMWTQDNRTDEELLWNKFLSIRLLQEPAANGSWASSFSLRLSPCFCPPCPYPHLHSRVFLEIFPLATFKVVLNSPTPVSIFRFLAIFGGTDLNFQCFCPYVNASYIPWLEYGEFCIREFSVFQALKYNCILYIMCMVSCLLCFYWHDTIYSLKIYWMPTMYRFYSRFLKTHQWTKQRSLLWWSLPSCRGRQ